MIVVALVTIIASIAQADSAPSVTAVEHVHVLSMTSDTALSDVTVLVVGDHIAAIGSDVQPPAGARRVDRGGSWLIPGLIDLHGGPVDPYDGPQLDEATAGGVTTVRVIAAAEANGCATITVPRATGPTLVSVPPPFVDPDSVPGLRWAALAARALAALMPLTTALFVYGVAQLWRWRRLRRDGRRERPSPLVARLRNSSLVALLALGCLLAVAGPLPVSWFWRPTTGLGAAIPVETPHEARRLVHRQAQRGCDVIGVDPLMPSARYDAMEEEAVRQGMTIVDVAVPAPHPPGTTPADRVLRRMAQRIRGGETFFEALCAVTRSAADSIDALGLSSRRGTIAVGNVADLILLDADPRRDRSSLRRPEAVMARGHWVSLDR